MIQNYEHKTSVKWYNDPFFPFIPVISFRPENKNNTSHFCFEWLFLKIWTLDCFEFELSITTNSHFGFGITAILPYLRVICCVPVSERISILWMKHLWRKPKYNDN